MGLNSGVGVDSSAVIHILLVVKIATVLPLLS